MEQSRVSPQRLHEDESMDNENITVLHLREQFERAKSKCCFFDRSYKVFEKLAALAEELENKNEQLESEMNKKSEVVSLLEIEKNKLQGTITEFEVEKLLFMEERSELEDLVQKLKNESEENLNMKIEVAEKLHKSEDKLCLVKDRISELERESKYDKMVFESKEIELETIVLKQKNELEDKLKKSEQNVYKLENENKIFRSDLDRKEVKILKIVRLEAENDVIKVEKKFMKDKISRLALSESKMKHRIVELQRSLDTFFDVSDKLDIEIKTKTTEEYIEEDKKVVFEEGPDLHRTTPDAAVCEPRPPPPQLTSKTKSRIIKSPLNGSH